MRKEGFWSQPDRFVQRLNIESWETTITALIGKPILICTLGKDLKPERMLA
jgi:hypothetical protein